MLRKIFKTGNSTVVSLPREFLTPLGLTEGNQVEVSMDAEKRQIVIRPASPLAAAGVDEPFARQLAEFIEQYRPALEELAR
jgi:putative addiction module antidote